MSKKEYNPTTLLIRRCIAIVLTILAVVALFWPSAVSLGGTLRTEKKIEIRNVERTLGDMGDDNVYAEYIMAGTAYQSVCSILKNESRRLKELQKALTPGEDKWYELDDKLFVLESAVDMVEGLHQENTIGEIEQDFYATVYRAFKNLGVSFAEMREVLSKLPYFADKTRELWPAEAEEFSGELAIMKYAPIGYNVLFFLVIALGAAAVVMMALNRSGILTVVHAIFTVLLAAIAIGLWIMMLVGGVSFLRPGVSAFAAPILAIAACFVYKRDRNCAGILPKREKTDKPVQQSRHKAPAEPKVQPFESEPIPEPAEEIRVPESSPFLQFTPRPANRIPEEPMIPETPVEPEIPETPVIPDIPEEPEIPEIPVEPKPFVQAAPDRSCPVCGTKVEAGSKFCTLCGADLLAAPEPEPEPTPACPNCGAEILPGMKFCVRCGTKLI